MNRQRKILTVSFLDCYIQEKYGKAGGRAVQPQRKAEQEWLRIDAGLMQARP